MKKKTTIDPGPAASAIYDEKSVSDIAINETSGQLSISGAERRRKQQQGRELVYKATVSGGSVYVSRGSGRVDIGTSPQKEVTATCSEMAYEDGTRRLYIEVAYPSGVKSAGDWYNTFLLVALRGQL